MESTPYLMRPHQLRHYIALALLLLVVAGILLARYLVGSQAFAFVDIGSDSFFQFYPMQTEFVRLVHEGDWLGWSHRLGLGAYLGPAMDPSLLLALLWPTERQLDARAWIYLAKILSSGLLFFAYLREIRMPAQIAAVGALCYALNGYLMANGQWDPHGTEVPLFALLLFAIERHLRGGGIGALVVAGAMVGLHNPFSLYTCSLFCTVYVLARQVIASDRPGFAAFATSSVRLASFYCLGLLLVAPVLLPNIAALFDSPRVGGSASIQSQLLGASLQPNDHGLVFSMVAGLFDKSILGIGDHYTGWGNYFEGPGFYVGLLPLLLVTQLFARGASPAERRLGWFIVVVVATYLIFPFIRFATYGFGHLAFRLSTLWVSLLILIGGVTAMRRIGSQGISLGILMATGTLLAALLAWVHYSDLAHASTPRVTLLFLLLLVYGCLLFAFDNAKRADAAPLALGAVLLLELFVTAYGNLNERVAVRKDGNSVVGSYDDGTSQAITWLRDNRPEFAVSRVEKNYNSVFLCDSLIQNYRGVASYFFHGSALTAIHDGFGMQRVVPSVSYIGHVDVPGLMPVFGVRYLLSRNGAAPPGWQLAHRAGDIDIFEDLAAEGLAQFRALSVTDVKAMRLPPEARAKLARGHVIVDSRVAALIELPTATGTAAGAPRASGIAHLVELDNDRLRATVQATVPGITVFAVPYNRGWRARINGSPATMVPVNFGFIGVPVDLGRHVVELSYYPPYRALGWLAALAAAAIIAAVVSLRVRRRRSSSHWLGRSLR